MPDALANQTSNHPNVLNAAGRLGGQGALPDALGNLTALTRLVLLMPPQCPECRVPLVGQGGLPDALGNLTALTQLVLRGNALTGPLPAWLAGLPALRYAWLGDNNFSGPVPASWCSAASANASLHLQARQAP